MLHLQSHPAISHSLHNNMNQRSAELENALFIMGPFGGSDYHYALFQEKSIHEIETMVPKVVDAIMSSVRGPKIQKVIIDPL